jgi:hypothetical protein
MANNRIRDIGQLVDVDSEELSLVDQIINELNQSCAGLDADKCRWTRNNISHMKCCTLDDYYGEYLCPMCEKILSLYGKICIIETKYLNLIDQKDKRIRELEKLVKELD